MRQQKLKVYQKRLIQKHQELTQYYHKSMSKTAIPVSDGSEDYVDYAVNSYTKEFLLSLSDLDRRRLRDVEAALRKIEKTGFGICEQCDSVIPEKRLKAVPWARHCLRCQELEEKKQTVG
ncbi:TraR/DksA family transcriptional regulator [Acidobacteriota bacterium]